MRKVLVVDDEAAITDGLTALFEMESIGADGAYDRTSAEALLEHDFYPVVLADLRLRTEQEGLLLLESIRRLSPRSRIATLTAYATPEVEQEILSKGSSVVLRKPMEFDEIIAVVVEMLDAIEQEVARHEAANAPLDLDALYSDVRRVLHSIPQRRFGLTPDETEDLVQDVWLLFLEKRDAIENHRPWLTGTIVNLCKQRIYKNTRTREHVQDLGEDDFESLGTARHPEFDAMMLHDALARLDERGRQLCTLIGLEGRSYDEVSAELGLPIGSIGPLFIRAKAKLQKMMSVTH